MYMKEWKTNKADTVWWDTQRTRKLLTDRVMPEEHRERRGEGWGRLGQQEERLVSNILTVYKDPE